MASYMEVQGLPAEEVRPGAVSLHQQCVGGELWESSDPAVSARAACADKTGCSV